MKTFSYSIGAGETVSFPGGKFFMLIDSTDPVDVTFQLNNSHLDESGTDVLAGYKARPKDGFDLIHIYSATAQTIKVGITRGQGDYDRSAGSVDASIVKGATIAHSKVTCNGASTLIAAASATRKAINIVNAGTTTLYIGATGVTTGTGFKLLPGSSYSFTESPKAAFYAASSGAGGDCRVFEESE